ncbi:MAG: DUF2309 domain-containing protein [Oligoflexus sp.]|nr:DUF2309 domain-containing protein [Oligoflexus sp.]
MLRTFTMKERAITERTLNGRSGADLQETIRKSLDLAFPSWPLQNAVAVNPFWNFSDRHFADVMDGLSPILHADLYMSVSFYMEKYRDGSITETALLLAIDAEAKINSDLPCNIETFLDLSRQDDAPSEDTLVFSEFLDRKKGGGWGEFLQNQAAKYAAAYFDCDQALVKFPWKEKGFWQAWKAAMLIDRSLFVRKINAFDQYLSEFDAIESFDHIGPLLKRIGLDSSATNSVYFARLLARNIGWASQFRIKEWSLSDKEHGKEYLLDFLLALFAYDYILIRHAMDHDATNLDDWRQTFRSGTTADYGKQRSAVRRIWQNALELSNQRSVAEKIVIGQMEVASPKYQMIFCIDVRSEPLRRSLEKTSPDISTVGFAGFFGLPIEFVDATSTKSSHRLPVLLRPNWRVREDRLDPSVHTTLASKQSSQYFLNFRKASFASFLFVELFGIFSLLQMLGHLLKSLLPTPAEKRLAEDFGRPGASRMSITDLDDIEIDADSQVQVLAGILKHLGLKDKLGRLVVLTGHGSATSNNMFAAVLKCGACGGHSGDVNARLLSSMLNNPEIRAKLESHKIFIPKKTWFLSAIHETVSDSLLLLDEPSVPASHREDLASLTKIMTLASKALRKSQAKSRSVGLNSRLARRMESWSELRPEWALAGNASFIIAPRSWTRAIDLGGRSFLHDYIWQEDEGFSTLELILTAPMIVTNWINMQYYASVVAPEVYGAGNKTLHNLVNETAVQEGNEGDLRVGLPLQSVHDGSKWMHDPIRLSVFIAAPREVIESIVRKHELVRNLVENEWLHMLRIDEDSKTIEQRLPSGSYRTHSKP